MKTSHMTTFAAAVSLLAVSTGAVLADNAPQAPLWEGVSSFAPFSDENVTYNPQSIGTEDEIKHTISNMFGLPVESARYPLFEDGASIVVYTDPDDVQIDYTDENGTVTPSQDDLLPYALSVVAFYDGQGNGYVIGTGLIPEECTCSLTPGTIEDYSYYVPGFMMNKEGQPHFTAPATIFSEEKMNAANLHTTHSLEIGDVTISQVSDPDGVRSTTGSFLMVADSTNVFIMGATEAGNDELFVASAENINSPDIARN